MGPFLCSPGKQWLLQCSDCQRVALIFWGHVVQSAMLLSAQPTIVAAIGSAGKQGDWQGQGQGAPTSLHRAGTHARAG